MELLNNIKNVTDLGSKRRVKCPCGWSEKEFLPYGAIPRKNAMCPKCGSLERHRLYYFYLKDILPKNKKLKVLHFAPEKIINRLFKTYRNIDYVSADIEPGKAMRTEDLTKLSFSNNSFDIIFCSHVLEHIKEDRKAMAELFRVLKPWGFAILQVPIRNHKKTFEDFSITDPKEREKLFWGKGHVRLYGNDYKKILESAGFRVKVDKYSYLLSKDFCKRHALIAEDIYLCSK